MASPPSASPANILFFSPGCEYSREIVGLINANQLRTKFLMVDVGIKQYKVPDFVDRVPMILIKASNQLVIDENLPVYINTLVSASASASSAAGLETIAMSDMGGRGGFSFLDGAGGEEAAGTTMKPLGLWLALWALCKALVRVPSEVRPEIPCPRSTPASRRGSTPATLSALRPRGTWTWRHSSSRAKFDANLNFK